MGLWNGEEAEAAEPGAQWEPRRPLKREKKILRVETRRSQAGREEICPVRLAGLPAREASGYGPRGLSRCGGSLHRDPPRGHAWPEGAEPEAGPPRRSSEPGEGRIGSETWLDCAGSDWVCQSSGNLVSWSFLTQESHSTGPRSSSCGIDASWFYGFAPPFSSEPGAPTTSS